MAADIFVLKDVLIHQQLHPVVLIVHQSHDAHRTGLNVQIPEHIVRIGK